MIWWSIVMNIEHDDPWKACQGAVEGDFLEMWWGTRERIWETQNNYKSEKNDVEVIIMICELFFIHLQLPVYWQQEMLKRAGVYDQWWSMKIDHTVPSCNSCSISIFQKISCQPSSMDHLGKPTPSKMDEFSEKFRRGGGGHFQSKNLYCRFWTFIKGFFRTIAKKFNAILFSENSSDLVAWPLS